MRSIFFISLLAVVVLVMSACSPKPQDDCGFVQNVYGQRITWQSKLPVRLVITPAVPIELRSAIYRAAETWKSRLGKNVFELTEDGSKAPAAPGRDKKNAIYFLSNWESDKSSEQGRTSVYWAGDEIQEADIRINAADFSYYNLNPHQLVKGSKLKKSASTDGYSFEALILHEMGHFLGLRHRDKPGEDGSSVMATHLSPFNNRTALTGTDNQAVTCEYN